MRQFPSHPLWSTRDYGALLGGLLAMGLAVSGAAAELRDSGYGDGSLVDQYGDHVHPQPDGSLVDDYGNPYSVEIEDVEETPEDWDADRYEPPPRTALESIPGVPGLIVRPFSLESYLDAPEEDAEPVGNVRPGYGQRRLDGQGDVSTGTPVGRAEAAPSTAQTTGRPAVRHPEMYMDVGSGYLESTDLNEDQGFDTPESRRGLASPAGQDAGTRIGVFSDDGTPIGEPNWSPPPTGVQEYNPPEATLGATSDSDIPTGLFELDSRPTVDEALRRREMPLNSLPAGRTQRIDPPSE